MSLTVVIIARDEAKHIAGALESVRGLADECLVLLDERTTDNTAEIAEMFGAIVSLEPWRGFPNQRNHALALSKSEWVFFLDGDERVTDELREELARMVSGGLDAQVAGVWVPRKNQFFGKVLRGGGWYPDRQLRLLRRDKAQYDPQRTVHETVVLQGEALLAQGHLFHLNIEHFGEFWRKQTSYAIQEAQTLYLAGRRARWRNFVGAPLREFYRRFVQLGGYRDGALGLFLCAALAYFEIVKFVHLKGLDQFRS
jgi:glycosyltransferase involved in cell wall biosynthesis